MNQNFENGHSQQANLYDSIMDHETDIITPIHHSDDRFTIKWDSYYKYCELPLNKAGNRIRHQLECSQLSGATVRWEGLVTSIEISNLDNTLERLLTTYLPDILSDIIVCWYGEPNDVNKNDDAIEFDDVRTILKQKRRCNLNAWNSYVFNVNVKMSSGMLTTPTEISLRASHAFTNFTKYLNESDRVWFKGIILKRAKVNPNLSEEQRREKLSGSEPLIDLTAIGCVSCDTDQLADTTIVTSNFKLNERIKDLRSGFKYLLNVLFNPVIIFK